MKKQSCAAKQMAKFFVFLSWGSCLKRLLPYVAVRGPSGAISWRFLTLQLQDLLISGTNPASRALDPWEVMSCWHESNPFIQRSSKKTPLTFNLSCSLSVSMRFFSISFNENASQHIDLCRHCSMWDWGWTLQTPSWLTDSNSLPTHKLLLQANQEPLNESKRGTSTQCEHGEHPAQAFQTSPDFTIATS